MKVMHKFPNKCRLNLLLLFVLKFISIYLIIIYFKYINKKNSSFDYKQNFYDETCVLKHTSHQHLYIWNKNKKICFKDKLFKYTITVKKFHFLR